MCGIVGIVGPKACETDVRAVLENMTSILVHRGPDDVGFYTDDSVSLGFRRLSIIDLTSGNQPIFNEDRTCVIVFNGEIYNFKELRSDLIKRGHSFYTNTDSETIIHLYEEHGDECVQWLNGMFAFCIWDMKKKHHMNHMQKEKSKNLHFYYDCQ